jgi:hypothetical protein
MYLDNDTRHKLYNALLQEKFAIQSLMSFFQNEMDINKEDVEEYLRLENSIINTLRNVSDILRDEFNKA